MLDDDGLGPVKIGMTGVRIGSRERLVRRRHGRPFFSAPDLYSGGPELVHRPRHVTQMSVGDVPEVRHAEACS